MHTGCDYWHLRVAFIRSLGRKLRKCNSSDGYKLSKSAAMKEQEDKLSEAAYAGNRPAGLRGVSLTMSGGNDSIGLPR